MNDSPTAPRSFPWYIIPILLCWILISLVQFGTGRDGLALLLVGVTLILWLSEVVPSFVPTLLLVAGSLAFLGSEGSADPASVLFKRMADPVLGLFFCGMCLGLILRRHGIDQAIARLAFRLSHGNPRKALRYAMLATACLAMWTTNSTAMAICLPAFGGAVDLLQTQNPKQARGFLIGLAMAANFGGMATPIGTAPNALAIAALEQSFPISFGSWMAMMLPLAILLILVTEYLVLRIFYRHAPSAVHVPTHSRSFLPMNPWALALFIVTVGLWLTESWHGIHPLAIGFGAASLGFFSRLLQTEDLKDIDWDVLLLIAGGLLLGHLLEEAGWMKRIAASMQNLGLGELAQMALIIAMAAIGSAISSNTATAVLMIPLAMQVDAQPYSAIAVAAACSIGVPFTISTPANALIAGRYQVKNLDLMKVGLPLTLGGCLLLVFTVKFAVQWILQR